MDVACDHCQARFKIPDEKVPKNQVFAMTCPKCKQKFSVDTRVEAPAAKPKEQPSKTLMDEVASDSYSASDKPFDFLEEGAETALVCEPDEGVRETVQAALKNMGYHVTSSKNAREVLKQMRFHVFDMVAINELFDTTEPDQNNILKYMDRLSMDIRRNMFVVLLSDRFRTQDNMAAFNKSVNLIVNLSNVGDFEKIVQRGITDNKAFYKVYRECLIKAGRA